MGKHGIEDKLVEFKPRMKGTVYGVKNYNSRAYVLDKGEPKGSWEKRYVMWITRNNEEVGHARWTNDLSQAKEWARSAVKGRAFRSFIRRMG